MNTIRITALLSAICAVSCAGSGSIPTVEILSASPDTLTVSDDEKDDLTIAVRYSDPDGDLGQGIARIFDCYAEGLVTDLPIPRIANEDAVAQGASISGEMTLVVADVGAPGVESSLPKACADQGVSAPPEGKRVFCVVLIDAEGNESEGACTGQIAVEP